MDEGDAGQGLGLATDGGERDADASAVPLRRLRGPVEAHGRVGWDLNAIARGDGAIGWDGCGVELHEVASGASGGDVDCEETARGCFEH